MFDASVAVKTCPECGGPLECFEGESYCPDCLRFGLADAGSEVAARQAALTNRDIDLLCAQYLDALDRQDFDALGAIRERAGREPALEVALHELHEALAAE
jgi:hypothetical protein